MSGNNSIFIDRKTCCVYYQPCADNDGYGDLIGRGKDVEEALDIAQRFIDEQLGGMLEYGITVVKRGE